MSSLRSLASYLVLATIVSTTFAQPRLQIQPCVDGWSAGTFTYNSNTKQVLQNNLCVDYDSTSLILTTCDNSARQQWQFNTDGTVQNIGDNSNCFNVLDGYTNAGSIVGMYSCGTRAVAQNDLFWLLPATSQIFANESGFCLASAAPPPPPCSSFTCCSLNGEWSSSTQSCTCYPPWTGTNCSTMDLLPAQGPYNGYGMNPNLTTWGGLSVFYNNEYHLLVTEIENHCPLTNWGSNSACIHATAATPDGPFVRQNIAVDIWCHNPQVITMPNGSNTVFLLFHIGDGTHSGNVPNCTKSDSVDSNGDITTDNESIHGSTYLRKQNKLSNVRVHNSASTGSTLHMATDPAGPWIPVQSQPPSCNNPAPFYHPNGTWYLLCDSSTLYSSPSYLGPWTRLLDVHPSGGVPGSYEDAFLWVDPRGNWHIIFHVYTTDVPSSCVNSTVSGHFFSPDGWNWMASPTEPFGNYVEFTDGSSMLLSTRERPKLLFNSQGEPTHLYNGVCGGTSYCAPTPCVNCKYNYWDFTLVQPLNLNNNKK